MGDKVFYNNCTFLLKNQFKVLSYSPSTNNNTHKKVVEAHIPLIKTSGFDAFTIKGGADYYGIGMTTARYLLEQMVNDAEMVKVFTHGKVAYFFPLVNKEISVMGSLDKASSKKSGLKYGLKELEKELTKIKEAKKQISAPIYKCTHPDWNSHWSPCKNCGWKKFDESTCKYGVIELNAATITSSKFFECAHPLKDEQALICKDGYSDMSGCHHHYTGNTTEMCSYWQKKGDVKFHCTNGGYQNIWKDCTSGCGMNYPIDCDSWKPIGEDEIVKSEKGAKHCSYSGKHSTWKVLNCTSPSNGGSDCCGKKSILGTNICKFYVGDKPKKGHCTHADYQEHWNLDACTKEIDPNDICYAKECESGVCKYWQGDNDSYTIHIVGVDGAHKLANAVIATSKEAIKKGGADYFKQWGKESVKSDGKPVKVDETVYEAKKDGVSIVAKNATGFPVQYAPDPSEEKKALATEKQKLADAHIDYTKPFAKKGGKVKVSHNSGHYNSSEKWVKVWKLDNLKLVNEAADFYCLYDLSLDFDDVEPIFAKKRDYLEGQFSRYVDMAVGGEFRHCHGSVYVDEVNKFRKKSPLHELIVGKHMKNDSRFGVWVDWFDVRKEYGLDALKVVVEGFNTLSWSTLMGGKTWGRCAKVLHDYLCGDMTKTMFVDTVWSLQHNNNIVLDKAWSINGDLAFILDCKFKGNIEAIVGYATEPVKKLWKEKRGVK